MARSRTPDGARERYVEEMPPGVGEVFHALWQEVVHSRSQWDVFCEMYATDDENVELLGRTAPGFFGFVRGAFYRNVLLGIARLTDPAGDRPGNTNLSLELLINRLAAAGESTLADSLRPAWERLQATAKPIRKHRHKRLAHSDADVSLNRVESSVLPGITLDDVTDVLERICTLMNEVESELTSATTWYEGTVPQQVLGPLWAVLEAAERHWVAERQ